MGSSKSPKKTKTDSGSNGKETSAPNRDFLVVGIGASAGGIKPLKDFFSRLPGDSGMAFVVILHLSPEFESHLHDVIQKHTPMPVIQVQESLKVEPDHVYVIPPGKNLILIEGEIKLAPQEPARGERVPIDLFLRTLAAAYGKNGVGVILSGTGADGTVGLKRLKEAGGITIVQEPAEAEYDGMPRSAIRTKMVDMILPVAEMPEKLLSYKRGTEKIKLPETDDEVPPELGTNSLLEVLALVRVRTGHDFSNYKQPTMLRRIARRMQVHGVTDIPSYLKILSRQPEEVPALLRDLLISVTNFFRDKEAFEALENQVIPSLFANKNAHDQVRVWCVGCATGEEAFSLAILLREYAERLPDPPKIQIFASDIDEPAISHAREGRYDETIELDVSPDRLRRFFEREGNYYHVKKEVRQMILFAPHNILRDPPFSRQDLITCRNLLIYLNRQTQERILEIFHFALRDEGYLFLGASESAETVPALFGAVDKKIRIYKMRPSATKFQGVPAMPTADRWRVTGNNADGSNRGGARSYSLPELHHELVEQFSPPSVLVNENYDILHLSEKATQYLRFTGGEPTRNLSKVAHPALRPDLLATLFSAKQENMAAESRHLPLEINGEKLFVNITVHPIEAPENARGFFLVIFDDLKAESLSPEALHTVIESNGEAAMEAVIRRLEEDLQRTKERLRMTIEQNETSVEELKASNEELQAINEELRSAAEQLESSKEELQSVNEELTTVNHELKDKIDEVSRAHSDLQNLISSTDIGTIFLDRALRIKRFTPPVRKIFNIIPSDLGRPVKHLTHHLDYEDLLTDVQEVMESLQAVEREVRSEDNRWYIARFVPYRTAEDRIDGVLLTFMDFTERRMAEAALRESEKRYRTLFDSVPVAVYTCDADGTIQEFNRRAVELWGREPEKNNSNEKFCGSFGIFYPDGRVMPHEECPMARALRGETLKPGELEILVEQPDGTRKNVIVNPKTLKDENGEVAGAINCLYDITDRKQAENALRESEERLRLIMDSAEDYAIMTLDGAGQFTAWNTGAEKIFGFSEEEVIGKHSEIIFTPEDRAKGEPLKELETARREGRAADERYHMRKDGSRFYVSGVMMRLQGGNEKYSFAKIARDLTERQQMEEALKEADRRKDEFLATLAHELRNPLAPIRSGLEIVRRATTDKEARMEALGIIERQTNQVVHLVDDLLDISRISQGKIKLKKTRMELKTAVEMALETSRELIESAGHQITITLPEKPVYLDADLMRITQILLNLLNNSVKYTPPGGKIWLSAGTAGKELVIRFQDNGIGIPPEMLTRIFEMFSQIKNTSEQARGGLGIGLSVVKKLVEMHGGSVVAFSDGEGKGSEFVLRLPLADEQTAPESKGPSESEIAQRADVRTTEPAENATPQNHRILVVDDNVDAAQMLEVLLSMEGHEVRTAYDGESGIETAREFQPDVCLLDIGLPEMDGYETARQLRQILPASLLISISGWGQEEDRRRSNEAGFNFHLVKPVEIEDINKLLAEKK